MSDLLTQFNNEVSAFNAEYAKFSEKGNGAAGKRARKALGEVKKLAQTLRLVIQEQKNAVSAK